MSLVSVTMPRTCLGDILAITVSLDMERRKGTFPSPTHLPSDQEDENQRVTSTRREGPRQKLFYRHL